MAKKYFFCVNKHSIEIEDIGGVDKHLFKKKNYCFFFEISLGSGGARTSVGSCFCFNFFFFLGEL